jgi:hypothetical protein
MKLDCPICLEAYDLKERVPRVFPNCGHSVCSFCISQIINKHENNFVVCCPNCRSLIDLYEVRKENESYIDVFPINIDLKQIVDSFHESINFDKTLCSIHNAPIESVCLDTQCLGQKVSCYKCGRQNHLACKPDLSTNLSAYPLPFNTYSYPESCYSCEENMTEIIKSVSKDFEQRLLAMTTEFASKMSSYMVKDAAFQKFSPRFDPYQLKLFEEPETNHQNIEPYNKLEVIKTAKSVRNIKVIISDLKERSIFECQRLLDAALQPLEDARRSMLSKKQSEEDPNEEIGRPVSILTTEGLQSTKLKPNDS